MSWSARVLLVGVAVLAGVLFLQAVPIPGLANTLGPAVSVHARDALSRIEPAAVPANTPQSVAPADSVDAALRLCAYGLIAWVSFILLAEPRFRVRLAWLIVGVGVFEALYGAGEYLSGHQRIFGYAKRYYLDEATGTFINRNHFGGYLAMILPFALALAIPPMAWRSLDGNRRDRLFRFARGGGLRSAIAGIAAVCIWAGVFLSYSRGALLAAILATIAFALGSSAKRRTALRIAATATIPICVLAWFAIRVPGERFVDLPAEVEGGISRLMVARTSLGLVMDAPLLGYGFGTFESVFRLRKPLADRFRFDHAHNEPLQLLVEGGLIAAAAVILCVSALVAARLAPNGLLTPADPILAASWASLAAVGAHSFVEFPLRIPAIAVLASVVAAMTLISANLRSERTGEAGSLVSISRRRRLGEPGGTNLAGPVDLSRSPAC